MKILRYLLFPVVPIYFMVTWLRNILYDLDIKKSKSYDFPVICVGNLSAGGTGKTPMIEYLVNLLKTDYKVATLSRGYKRKTTGFQLADADATAASIGDEPFQFYSKFKKAIWVAVDSNRQQGISKLHNLDPKPEVILLDDAFQHRKVKAGFSVLLTTYAHPFYNDIVLPTGDLRESRVGAKRADCIVVTKCPNTLSRSDKDMIIKRISPLRDQSVFFSSIVYSDVLYTENSTETLEGFNPFTLVTGIANASPLVAFLKEKGMDFNHLNFKDHHDFTPQDIAVLAKKDCIITTEKDFMRLKQYPILKGKLFYLPIHVKIDDAHAFNECINRFLLKTARV